MADAGHNSIDRVFDLIDNVVGAADRVLNRTKYTEEQQGRRARRGAVIDTSPSVKVRSGKAEPASTSTSTSLSTRRPFRIMEAIAAETGATIFIVTNGVKREEFASRDVAEKVLRMLEAAP